MDFNGGSREAAIMKKEDYQDLSGKCPLRDD